ncbi:MAG: TolC family protein [Pyrinomonadaceae bacterium]
MTWQTCAWRSSAWVRALGLVLVVGLLSPMFAQQPELPPPFYDYPFANTVTSVRKLSLEDAVSLALGFAAVYRQSTFDERSAAEDVRQSRAALLPQFSAPVAYLGTTPSVVRFPDQPPTFSYAASSAINETSAYLNTSGTLDIAGHLRAGLQRSRALLAAAHAGTQAARRSLVLATADSYYGLLLAQEKRRLADEALSLAEGVAASSAGLQAQGKVESAEVDRARASALARRDELEQARLGEFLAMNNLRTLIGTDFAVHLIVESITRRAPTSNNFVDLGAQSFLTRPELAQIDAFKLAANAEARQARAELRPQLTYSINAGFDTASLGRLRQYSGGSLLMSLSVPIFNFGASRSREKQARIRAEALDVQRQNTETALKAEFFGARAGLASAFQRIRYTLEAAEITERNLNTVFAGYHEGKLTLLEVNDAQSAYAAARLAYYQAIADYYGSRYRLDADPFAGVIPSSASSTNSTTNVSPQSVNIEAGVCTDGPDGAPEIGGLRLGLTEAELRAIFPRLSTLVDRGKGLSRATVWAADLGSNMKAEPIFQGIQQLEFEFYQGRVSYLRIAWPVTNQWIGESEFVSHVSDLLQISGRWRSFYDWNDKEIRDSEDLRDVALECTGYRLSVGVGIEGLGGNQTPHLELEDLMVMRKIKATK